MACEILAIDGEYCFTFPASEFESTEEAEAEGCYWHEVMERWVEVNDK